MTIIIQKLLENVRLLLANQVKRDKSWLSVNNKRLVDVVARLKSDHPSLGGETREKRRWISLFPDCETFLPSVNIGMGTVRWKGIVNTRSRRGAKRRNAAFASAAMPCCGGLSLSRNSPLVGRWVNTPSLETNGHNLWRPFFPFDYPTESFDRHKEKPLTSGDHLSPFTRDSRGSRVLGPGMIITGLDDPRLRIGFGSRSTWFDSIRIVEKKNK